MKSVVFIRHAKSSWSDIRLPDHDRPLNKRGLRDAPYMAKILRDTGLKPDLILSSTANRAVTTATIFAKEFGYPTENIDARKDLYLCWYEDLETTIRSLSDDWNTVFVFNHNPTLEYLVNTHASEPIEKFPTCAMAHIEANIPSWNSFLPKKTTLKAHFFPKQFPALQ